MIDIISRLFTNCGYEHFERYSINISNREYDFSFITKNENGAESFIILHTEASVILEDKSKLDEIYVQISSIIESCDKYTKETSRNTSMIFLMETRNDEDIYELAFDIEENPYYFKKYILDYSSVEEKYLRDFALQNADLKKTILDYIYNRTIFTNYKSNNINEALYSILVKIAIKIPVFPMRFEKSNNLETVQSILDSLVDSSNKINKVDANFILSSKALVEPDDENLKSLVNNLMALENGNEIK